jgi:predicted ATPase
MSETSCACAEARHDCRLVVLTGGPGAGKTAVLEVVRRAFCEHVAVLPEAATILFGGGFPRHDTEPGQRAAQNAIFHVQRSMETMSREEGRVAIVLCDRGTLDGLAYWPGGIDAACAALGIRREEELARYRAVVHLRTPSTDRGYNHANPVRRESAAEAAELDARILASWDGHPRRVIVESEEEFLRKVARAVEAIRAEVPPCCRAHRIAELGEPAATGGCDVRADASKGDRPWTG